MTTDSSNTVAVWDVRPFHEGRSPSGVETTHANAGPNGTRRVFAKHPIKVQWRCVAWQKKNNNNESWLRNDTRTHPHSHVALV